MHGRLFVGLVERGIHWFFRYVNEKLVELSASVQLAYLTIDDSGEREASLTLNSVSLDDSAIVKAVATNAVGKSETSALLNVESKNIIGSAARSFIIVYTFRTVPINRSTL